MAELPSHPQQLLQPQQSAGEAAEPPSSMPPVQLPALDSNQPAFSSTAERSEGVTRGSNISDNDNTFAATAATDGAGLPLFGPTAPPLDPTMGHPPEWWRSVRTPDEIVDLLGLRECANTIVGSNQIRGVSGGQKKRVTIGEALLANARFLALDSITTGLDAATAYDVMRYINSWAAQTGGVVVAALQQATPEVRLGSHSHCNHAKRYQTRELILPTA